VIEVENTMANDNRNMRKHFQKVKGMYGGVFGLGSDRFATLLANLQPSIEDLQRICQLLHSMFMSVLDPTSVCMKNLFFHFFIDIFIR
jgi:hypothetical protein